MYQTLWPFLSIYQLPVDDQLMWRLHWDHSETNIRLQHKPKRDKVGKAPGTFPADRPRDEGRARLRTGYGENRIEKSHNITWMCSALVWIKSHMMDSSQYNYPV